MGALSVTANAATDKTFISIPQAVNPQQQATVKLVEAYYNAINQKNMDLLYSLLANNVIHDINQGDTEQGLNKFKAFMEAGNNSFDEKLNNIVIMTSQDGTYAAARWIDHGIYYKTEPGLGVDAKNQHYTLTGGHFFEIRNGKIDRVTTYYNATDFMRQIKQTNS